MGNVEIVQELYRAFSEKDYEAFQKICTSDVEWIQNEGFPNGSTHHGPDAVIEGVFKVLNNNWAFWRFQIEEYLDAGGSVIALGFYEGVHKVSQKSFRSPAAHVYNLSDGKVARFRQFTDTKVIWNAMS
jgi:hypothetical protein